MSYFFAQESKNSEISALGSAEFWSYEIPYFNEPFTLSEVEGCENLRRSGYFCMGLKKKKPIFIQK